MYCHNSQIVTIAYVVDSAYKSCENRFFNRIYLIFNYLSQFSMAKQYFMLIVSCIFPFFLIQLFNIFILF